MESDQIDDVIARLRAAWIAYQGDADEAADIDTAIEDVADRIIKLEAAREADTAMLRSAYQRADHEPSCDDNKNRACNCGFWAFKEALAARLAPETTEGEP